MALFKFLRPKSEEISKDELDSFIAMYLARLKLDDDFNEFLTEYNEKKDQALNSLKILENATLQNPNIPERAKHILDGNRNHYIQKTRIALSISMAPNSFLDVPQFHVRLVSNLHSLAKDIAKAHMVLGEFLSDERDDVEKAIRGMEQKTALFSRKLENKNVGTIKLIRDILKKMDEHKKEIEKYANELMILENELAEHTERKKRINTKISELRGGSHFIKLKADEELLEETRRKIKDEERELDSRFSDLKKPLKKAFRGKEEEKLALIWAEDTKDGLMKDTSLRIIHLLPSIAVHEDDEKKKERMNFAIKGLTASYLNAKRELLTSLYVEKERIENLIKGSIFSLQLSEQEGYLRTITNEITHYDERIKAIKSKTEHHEEKKSWREINDLLSKLNAVIID